MTTGERPRAIDFVFSSGIGKWLQRANTWLFRRTKGKFGASFRGAPVLLLTTIGRKSGQPRTVPLLYLDAKGDQSQLVIVASKGGYDEHPLWYRNLKANPDVEVEIAGKRIPMHSREANEEEREQLWPRVVAMYSDYQSYQSWTDRKIPLVILNPR